MEADVEQGYRGDRRKPPGACDGTRLVMPGLQRTAGKAARKGDKVTR